MFESSGKTKKLRVAVIGAGPAGLATCRRLSQHPDEFDFVCYEMCQAIGGVWLQDKFPNAYVDNKHQPAECGYIYDDLRTNLPVQTMSYCDFPSKTDSPTPFVRHEKVLEYMNSYCEHFNLTRFIRFNEKVKSVAPVGEKKYRVCTEINGDGEMFDAVMVCVGHYSKPSESGKVMFDNFSGLVMHSKAYRNAEQLKDCKKILIVGAGPSGFDIAVDIEQSSSNERSIIVACHTAFADANVSSSMPQNSIIQFKPDVKHVGENGNSIEFTDGSIENDVDAIIMCTGYDYYFPFLSKELQLHDDDMHLTPVYKHMLHIDYPTSLCFIDLPKIVLPFPLSDLQARYFIALLQKKFTLPTREQMLQWTEDDFNRRVQGFGWPKRFALKLGELQQEYCDDLSRESGVERLDPQIFVINRKTNELRIRNPFSYKFCTV